MKTIGLIGILFLGACGGEVPTPPQGKACASSVECAPPGTTDFNVTVCCAISTHTCEPAPHDSMGCDP